MPEAIRFESRCQFLLPEHSVVSFLGFGWRDVADGLQQPAMVEPIDPGERGKFDRLEAAPWTAAMDHLGLVESVDGLGEGVVIAVADASDRGFEASLGQPLGVADADVLRASV